MTLLGQKKYKTLYIKLLLTWIVFDLVVLPASVHFTTTVQISGRGFLTVYYTTLYIRLYY